MQNSRVGRWYIMQFAGQTVVDRMIVVDGKRKQQRYPRQHYKHLSLPDLEIFVEKLNGGEVTPSVDMPTVLAEFKQMLHAEIPTERDADSLYRCFMNDTFSYFSRLEPERWWTRQVEYGQLLSKGRGYKTIVSYVQIANRFLVHYEDKTGIATKKLKPFSKARLKQIRAATTTSPGKYILPEDWHLIELKPPADIASGIKLQHRYGLRRSEIFRLAETSVRRDCLRVLGKNRLVREIPHWWCSAAEAYRLVAGIVPVHVDTYSAKFDAYMEALGMDYKTHDIRRSYVTRSLRAYHASDVQLACGHDDIRTTMKYKMDDRVMDDSAYWPAGAEGLSNS